jgi:hypothetical protein
MKVDIGVTVSTFRMSFMPAVSIVKGAVVFAATHRPCHGRCNVQYIKPKQDHVHSHKFLAKTTLSSENME